MSGWSRALHAPSLQAATCKMCCAEAVQCAQGLGQGAGTAAGTVDSQGNPNVGTCVAVPGLCEGC